ncbi:MAG: ATP-binding protein [Treponema sp.]|nr:ATP-binding protein [Treponema sp.]MBQ6566041.1 ATP-binding protein [Treponema sp.]
MKREAYRELLSWKGKNGRKPLILNGARQVGKTWLLKEFGSHEYKHLAYINCDESPEMKSAFSDFDTGRLLRYFSALTGTPIEPGQSLIVLDEIQEVPLGLTALKYFCEEAPEYHVAVAGSLLGIGLHAGTGFPVGKVDEIDLHPLSFKEFITALGNEILTGLMGDHRWGELTALSPRFTELLRQYYYVGGMPAVVRAYAETRDVLSVRIMQKQILADYRRDFSKHVPADILPKVNMVWDSVPAQLAKENKKYVYSALRKGGRAKEFENAIQWLEDAGLVHKVRRVSKLAMPLKFYEDYDSFKLYALDLGLLGAMADVPAKDVLVTGNAFVEYKGAFTEQYVLQELRAAGFSPCYYSKENSSLEIDFVVQMDGLYPIEVKAEENLRSKSLRTVYEADKSLRPCRFSMSGYKEQDWMVNVPLYLAEEWMSLRRAEAAEGLTVTC